MMLLLSWLRLAAHRGLSGRGGGSPPTLGPPDAERRNDAAFAQYKCRTGAARYLESCVMVPWFAGAGIAINTVVGNVNHPSDALGDFLRQSPIASLRKRIGCRCLACYR